MAIENRTELEQIYDQAMASEAPLAAPEIEAEPLEAIAIEAPEPELEAQGDARADARVLTGLEDDGVLGALEGNAQATKRYLEQMEGLNNVKGVYSRYKEAEPLLTGKAYDTFLKPLMDAAGDPQAFLTVLMDAAKGVAGSNEDLLAYLGQGPSEAQEEDGDLEGLYSDHPADMQKQVQLEVQKALRSLGLDGIDEIVRERNAAKEHTRFLTGVKETSAFVRADVAKHVPGLTTADVIAAGEKYPDVWKTSPEAAVHMYLAQEPKRPEAAEKNKPLKAFKGQPIVSALGDDSNLSDQEKLMMVYEQAMRAQ